MDQQASNLLATLKRPSATPESKLALLNSIKSDIKHYRVPENAQGTIFECLKLCISQQASTSLVTAAFSTLAHIIKRLKIQDEEGKAITAHAFKLLPVLIERLSDHRDAFRLGASQALSDLWPFCTADVEHHVRDDAINGDNPKAREMGMQWIVRMHQEAGLHFKAFVPSLVTSLDFHDGTVREAAKIALVELFTGASQAAKNDLLKQLNSHQIRQTISAPVLAQLGIQQPTPRDDFSSSTRSVAHVEPPPPFGDSVHAESIRPSSGTTPAEEATVEPLFVHSQRELEDTFRAMEPNFDGKESEENWLLRDKDITRCRRLTRGNVPSDYHEAYMSGMKALLEGILKAANSLRTTMATNGCLLVQELARTLGPALEPFTEKYLQSFIKASAATKHIAAQQGNMTVDTIFQYVSYNVRLMQHIFAAVQDKNKQTRMFAAGWLKTLLNKNEGARTHYEHSGGLDLTEKTIRKGLDDADPKVKESMRITYWTYARIWPDRAHVMLDALDPKVRTALEKDSHNPNAASRASFAASTNSRASGARSALRERIAADKRRAGLPPRPQTATALSTPAGTRSIPNLHLRAQQMAGQQASARNVSNLSISSQASDRSREAFTAVAAAPARPSALMSGAARRPSRRPELTRPATADPYASKRVLQAETPQQSSPRNTPRQNSAIGSTFASRSAQRNASPAASPQRRPVSAHAPSSRAGSADVDEGLEAPPSDDFTLVIPSASFGQQSGTSPRQSHALPQRHHNVHESPSSRALESIPSVPDMPTAYRDRSPMSLKSPARASAHESRSPVRASVSKDTPERRNTPVRSSSRSPVISRSASPNRATPSRSDSPVATHGHSIVRQGSPLKTSATLPESSPTLDSHEEQVKVYEDTTADQDSRTPSDEAGHVLNELPINESVQRAPFGPPNSPPASADGSPQTDAITLAPNHIIDYVSPPLSPQSKAAKSKTRKLLLSGIERIKARTLDMHGFRKLGELVSSTDPSDLFGHESKKYDEYMLALCDFITRHGETLLSGSVPSAATIQELRRQALTLLKLVLTSQEISYQTWNKNGSWHARCLSATLDARAVVEGKSIVVKDIEALAQQAISGDDKEVILESISDFLERHPSTPVSDQALDNLTRPTSSGTDKPVAQATALALRMLGTTMQNSSSDETATKVERQSRVMQIASSRLTARDAEVRKADVELITVLHAVWTLPPAATINGQHHEGSGMDGDDISEETTTNGHDSETANADVEAQKDQSFWSALEAAPGGLPEASRNLIAYYLARSKAPAKVPA